MTVVAGAGAGVDGRLGGSRRGGLGRERPSGRRPRRPGRGRRAVGVGRGGRPAVGGRWSWPAVGRGRRRGGRRWPAVVGGGGGRGRRGGRGRHGRVAAVAVVGWRSAVAGDVAGVAAVVVGVAVSPRPAWCAAVAVVGGRGGGRRRSVAVVDAGARRPCGAVEEGVDRADAGRGLEVVVDAELGRRGPLVLDVRPLGHELVLGQEVLEVLEVPLGRRGDQEAVGRGPLAVGDGVGVGRRAGCTCRGA